MSVYRRGSAEWRGGKMLCFGEAGACFSMPNCLYTLASPSRAAYLGVRLCKRFIMTSGVSVV